VTGPRATDLKPSRKASNGPAIGIRNDAGCRPAYLRRYVDEREAWLEQRSPKER
jgi:hypothetical protein